MTDTMAALLLLWAIFAVIVGRGAGLGGLLYATVWGGFWAVVLLFVVVPHMQHGQEEHEAAGLPGTYADSIADNARAWISDNASDELKQRIRQGRHYQSEGTAK